MNAITEQTTLHLEVLAIQGASHFRIFLEDHQLHPLTVAIAAHVRYLTVWNIEHGIPISREHEACVRAGLFALTGIPFTAPLAIRSPTEAPKRRLSRVNLHQLTDLPYHGTIFTKRDKGKR